MFEGNGRGKTIKINQTRIIDKLSHMLTPEVCKTDTSGHVLLCLMCFLLRILTDRRTCSRAVLRQRNVQYMTWPVNTANKNTHTHTQTRRKQKQCVDRDRYVPKEGVTSSWYLGWLITIPRYSKEAKNEVVLGGLRGQIFQPSRVHPIVCLFA